MPERSHRIERWPLVARGNQAASKTTLPSAKMIDMSERPSNLAAPNTLNHEALEYDTAAEPNEEISSCDFRRCSQHPFGDVASRCSVGPCGDSGSRGLAERGCNETTAIDADSCECETQRCEAAEQSHIETRLVSFMAKHLIDRHGPTESGYRYPSDGSSAGTAFRMLKGSPIVRIASSRLRRRAPKCMADRIAAR